MLEYATTIDVMSWCFHAECTMKIRIITIYWQANSSVRLGPCGEVAFNCFGRSSGRAMEEGETVGDFVGTTRKL